MQQSFTFEALGTHWSIELFGCSNFSVIQTQILKIVQDFEDNYSRFKPDSLLSKLNNTKYLSNYPTELNNMLEFTLDMYKATKGVFNISVGSELEKSGYGKISDINSKVSLSLLDDISISDVAICIAPHVRLDFGGFGKGWLIDKLGNQLYLSGIKFVINGGGDILVDAPEFIELALEHPYDNSLMIGTISIKKGALAASSPLKRSWTLAGATKHHIVDPINPEESPEIASGFVTAPTALIADCLSTVFLLVDPEKRAQLALKYSAEYLQVGTDLSIIMSRCFEAKLN